MIALMSRLMVDDQTARAFTGCRNMQIETSNIFCLEAVGMKTVPGWKILERIKFVLRISHDHSRLLKSNRRMLRGVRLFRVLIWTHLKPHENKCCFVGAVDNVAELHCCFMIFGKSILVTCWSILDPPKSNETMTSP